MKTLHYYIISFVSVLCLSFVSHATAETGDALQTPFSKSDLVLVGNVINATKMISQNQTQYSITVIKYLKNEKPFQLITVIRDGIKPDKITNYDEVTYYNEPIFKEGDKVFLYLKNEGGKYKILSMSFGINTRTGGPPPEVIKFTSYQNVYHFGESITISGIMQKGLMYKEQERTGNSTLAISVYNPNHELYVSDKVPVNVDGSFNYVFKIRGNLGIGGNYEYDLTNSGMTGGTFEYVSSPVQQFKSGVVPDDIQCKSDFMLIFKARDGTPACVKPSSVSRLVEIGWGTRDKTIPVKNTDLALSYSITRGKLVGAEANFNTNSLVISLQTSSDGNLTLKLPRGLIDSVKNGKDESFSVIVDGKKTDYTEQKTLDYRIITLALKSGDTKVEIIPYCPPAGCGG